MWPLNFPWIDASAIAADDAVWRIGTGSGAGGPAWRTCDDPRPASAGLSVSAIARRTGRDSETVRKYIERGLELPVYGPRQVGRPGKLLPFVDYIRERLTAFPDLRAPRLLREIRERGYGGGYSQVKRLVAALRPNAGPRPYEFRFETPPGLQAQVDFTRVVVAFENEPGVNRMKRL